MLILNKLGIGVIWKTLASFDAIVTLGGKITAITLSSNIPISDEMRRNLILLPGLRILTSQRMAALVPGDLSL